MPRGTGDVQSATSRRRRRILVGCIFHESHGFSPHVTTGDQFEIYRGGKLIDQAHRSSTTLGGIVSKAQDLDLSVVPSVSVSAPPAGPVDHGFYMTIRDELVDLARREACDAVALELHGAMGTTELADAEGDLLAALSQAVGPDIPIGIGLDLHAHVTGAMLGAVDICIACKENPHSDVVRCGERVVEGLLAMLDGDLRPVTAMAKAPMILPGAAETAEGPLAAVHARARSIQAAHPEIWDISLYNVFRYVDDEDIGQAAVVISNGASDSGVQAAEELARLFWEWRERFHDDLLSIDQALDIVATGDGQRPYVLADMGDRVLAGAPGDSTAIIARALARSDGLRGAIPVTDPDSVEAATAAGVGAHVTLDIGGRLTPGFSPLKITGTITGVGDGRFIMAGPFRGGEETSLGQTAVLVVDDRLRILLTSKPGFTHDPAAFTSQGIDLRSQDFVVVKSGYHFKLNFAGIGTPLSLTSPGIGYYTRGQLDWKKARFWPEHDFGEARIEAVLSNVLTSQFHRPHRDPRMR
ncbi:M81 family metallopeptidase [Chelativorans salis]|uniref:M81 family metallopeptidase n=1 Tax=Chelativorans salis TaxID=2978478 RepID=A0ABT2LUS4_9HYPH|nr:M81 family metallopeptidase [Chelativorans sp. EGI FJ00035]MCT7378264.1 M81 family metallopeptidase [Chelativorans sp. EGI FJ00035]